MDWLLFLQKNVLAFFFFLDTSDNSQKHFRELQVKYFALKEKHDDLVEKLKFFSGVSLIYMRLIIYIVFFKSSKGV